VNEVRAVGERVLAVDGETIGALEARLAEIGGNLQGLLRARLAGRAYAFAAGGKNTFARVVDRRE